MAVRLALLLLLASPAAAEEGDAAYDVARARSAAASLTAAITAGFAKQPHAEVLSQADVRTMLSVEAERAVMGCDDEASCLAEISDTLGARYIVSTQLSRVDETMTLTVSVFDSVEGKVAGRETVKGIDVDDLMQKVPFIVDQVWAAPRDDADVRVYVRDARVDAAVFPLHAPSVISASAANSVQLAVGPGLMLLSCLIPCTWGCAPPLCPAPLTVVMVWLHNWLGPHIAPIGWPLLMAYGVWAMTSLLPLLVFGAALGYLSWVLTAIDTQASAGQNVDELQAQVTMWWLAAFVGAIFVPAVGAAAALATVPISTAAFGRPKRFDEQGDRFPPWSLEQAAPTTEVPPPAPALSHLRY
jgi:hypothetical protein